MKFGKRLQSEAARCEPGTLVDYKALKAAIREDAAAGDPRAPAYERARESEARRAARALSEAADALEADLAEAAAAQRRAREPRGPDAGSGGGGPAQASMWGSLWRGPFASRQTPPPARTAGGPATAPAAGAVSVGAVSAAAALPRARALFRASTLNRVALVKADKKRARRVGQARESPAATFGSPAASLRLARLLAHAEAVALTAGEGEGGEGARSDASIGAPPPPPLSALSCPVCLDVLVAPVVLPCAHTFCWGCLVAHASAHARRTAFAAAERAAGLGGKAAPAPALPLARAPSSPPAPSTPTSVPCPVCRQSHALSPDTMRVDSTLTACIEDLRAAAAEGSRAAAEIARERSGATAGAGPSGALDERAAATPPSAEEDQGAVGSTVDGGRMVTGEGVDGANAAALADPRGVVDPAAGTRAVPPPLGHTFAFSDPDPDRDTASSWPSSAERARDAAPTRSDSAERERRARERQRRERRASRAQTTRREGGEAASRRPPLGPSAPSRRHDARYPLLAPLPAGSPPPALTLVLDLDGTLVSSVRVGSARARRTPASVSSFVAGEGSRLNPEGVLVRRRPGLLEALELVRAAGVEIVIWTAGLVGYAEPVLDGLEESLAREREAAEGARGAAASVSDAGSAASRRSQTSSPASSPVSARGVLESISIASGEEGADRAWTDEEGSGGTGIPPVPNAPTRPLRLAPSRVPYLASRLYRDACSATSGCETAKDLSLLGREESRCLLVEDSPAAAALAGGRALLVPTYEGEDAADDVLEVFVAPLAAALARDPRDVREALPDCWCAVVDAAAERKGAAEREARLQEAARKVAEADARRMAAAARQPTPPADPASPALEPRASSSLPEGRADHARDAPARFAGARAEGAALPASPDAASPPLPPPHTLVVFDFDRTLVDVDVGEALAAELAPGHLERLRSHPELESWVPASNAALRDARAGGATPERVHETLDAVAREHLTAAARDMLRGLHARAPGVETHVLSDCHEVAIQRVLQAGGVDDTVRGIITNPSEFDPETGVLRVRPRSGRGADPHARTPADDRHDELARLSTATAGERAARGGVACPHCPGNLCKGAELRALRAARGARRVVYAGDGAGDLCAALSLGERDVLLPRRGARLEHLLREREAAGHPATRARVRAWGDHADLAVAVEAARRAVTLVAHDEPALDERADEREARVAAAAAATAHLAAAAPPPVSAYEARMVPLAQAVPVARRS